MNSETGLRSPGSPLCQQAGVRGDAGGGEGVSVPPSDFSASHVYFYSSVISASGFWWTHSNNNTVPTATGQGLALPQLGALHLLLGGTRVSNSRPNWDEGPHSSGGLPSRHPYTLYPLPRAVLPPSSLMRGVFQVPSEWGLERREETCPRPLHVPSTLGLRVRLLAGGGRGASHQGRA